MRKKTQNNKIFIKIRRNYKIITYEIDKKTVVLN